ncbi:MAG: HD domain-containing protein [Saccharofermentans sp.]|nr:HD domain-containing protein [Saccharofermentans sp.]
MNDLLIQETKDYTRELFSGNSDGHDLDHSLRVYSNAMLIAKEEQECDLEAVALAALLHDADDHKLFDTEDNENAVSFLKAHGVDEQRIRFIVEIIRSVSFSKNRGKTPDSAEGKIVQDADRLDAMGAVGIARTFAYGGKHGRPLDGGIEHFHEKLLLLKDEMNTSKGRELAESRHRFMEEYLAHFDSETELISN